MKILSLILAVLGVGFCIAAIAGHTQAWSAAALCFFAFSMIFITKGKKSEK